MKIILTNIKVSFEKVKFISENMKIMLIDMTSSPPKNMISMIEWVIFMSAEMIFMFKNMVRQIWSTWASEMIAFHQHGFHVSNMQSGWCPRAETWNSFSPLESANSVHVNKSEYICMAISFFRVLLSNSQGSFTLKLRTEEALYLLKESSGPTTITQNGSHQNIISHGLGLAILPSTIPCF